MSELNPMLVRLHSAIEVTKYNPPASHELIAQAEARLGQQLPDWLRLIYVSFNGFSGPTEVRYLYSLDGAEGAAEFTLFLRSEDWCPSWISRAIIFGENGVGGTLTTHWAALDGDLIEWCYADGEVFTALPCDLFEVWRREQEHWNEVG
jgi:hypothetical protein